MILFLNSIKQNNVLVMDVEFDQMHPIQVSGMLFEKINDLFIFQLSTSFNFYISREINRYTEKYTGITNSFLKNNGISHSEFLETFRNIMSDVDMENTLFVSHGAVNDIKVLKESGVTSIPKKYYCTYENSKKILDREGKLKLSDVALECGVMPQNLHNAYNDVIITTMVLSFLLKNEKEIYEKDTEVADESNKL